MSAKQLLRDGPQGKRRELWSVRTNDEKRSGAPAESLPVRYWSRLTRNWEMGSSMRIILILLVGAGLATAPGTGFAGDFEPRQIRIAQSGGGKNLSQAIDQVRKQTGGRILSAETRVSGNREIHHIKVLTKDGKVRTVKVPGRKRGG